MTYKEWFESHGKKHRAVMERLGDLGDDEVIAYFRFENMVEQEPAFCPLYQMNKKCHDMETLNCYLCGCPHFRFDDHGFYKEEEKTVYSYCAIHSAHGGKLVSKEAIHQDCSRCTIPHQESCIKQHFKRDWFEMMADVYKISN